MPDVRGGLLKRQPSKLMQYLQPYIDRLSEPSPGASGPLGEAVSAARSRLSGGRPTLGAIEQAFSAVSPYNLAYGLATGVGHAALGGADMLRRGVDEGQMRFPPEEVLPASLLAMPLTSGRGGLGAGPRLPPRRGRPASLSKTQAQIDRENAAISASRSNDLGLFKTTTPGRIIGRTKEKGGYTVSLVTGVEPTEGILAGKFPNEDPRTRVVVGPLSRKDVEGHATLNRKVLGLPAHNFGTWRDPDDGKTYLDVSVLFGPKDIRRATKFAEKTKQKSMAKIAPGKPVEFPKVGSFPGFVTGETTPEGVVPYVQRLQEMGGIGREYMAGQPTTEWWRQPNMERVYGKQMMPKIRGLLAATSTNTQPAPNVVTMSEYARRAIRDEPMIQPEFRVPETALSGHRMPQPGARLGLETGTGGRKHNLLAAARGETDPAAYHGPVVQEKIGALSGNRATIVLDRIQTRLAEQPSHGIFAMGKEGQSPTGANRQKVLDVITREARKAGEDPDTFSGNVWAGVREHVSRTGELYGTPLKGVQRGTAGSESKSYDDLFMDRVRAKAKHLGVSLKKMESMLRKGDAELLSHILVPTTALGAGLLYSRE